MEGGGGAVQARRPQPADGREPHLRRRRRRPCVQLRRRARHLSLLGALLRHRYDAPGRRAPPRRGGSGACGVEAVRAGASAAWPRLPARRTAVSLARARVRGWVRRRAARRDARRARTETPQSLARATRVSPSGCQILGMDVDLFINFRRTSHFLHEDRKIREGRREAGRNCIAN